MKELVYPFQFYTDAMFGKLGRFLRIIGFDVQIVDVSLPDSQIMEICIASERILVTRDRLFYELMLQKLTDLEWNPNHVVYSNQDDLVLELLDVFKTLKIDPDQFFWSAPENLPFTPRCSKCNGILNRVEKSTIIDKIKEGTANHQNIFWQCSNSDCQHVYWAGRHWDEIKRTLTQVKSSLHKYYTLNK